MSNVKRVYYFGEKGAEGKADMKNLLGGKGANLAEMCLLGLPVPAGFTITTDVCTEYYENNCTLPAELDAEICEPLERRIGPNSISTMLVELASYSKIKLSKFSKVKTLGFAPSPSVAPRNP